MLGKIKEYIKKLDIKFIGISVIAIVVISILCMFFGETTYSQKDLPVTYDSAISKLVINEIVTSNKGVYANANNEVCDYVELYNGSNEDILLSGYGLSDDESKIKWAFTNTTIKANGYIVVNLVGKNSDNPLDANFKLSSSKSERLILTNKNSKIIDAVDTISLEKNTCMARDEKGQWYVSKYCTPGFENSEPGLNLYHNSLLSDNNGSDIVVNEFLPRNNGNYIGKNGYFDKGAIELKNISNHIVDLGEYYISEDKYLPFMKKLGSRYISPNEIIVLYMGNGDYYDDNYLGFSFPSENGNIVISKDGKIVQEIEYTNISNGDSMCYQNGNYYKTSTISLGYENDAKGIEKFQKENIKNNSDLIISEVCNSNTKYLVQNGNKYYDYVELYNNSNSDINLSNYYLSDSDTNINMYQLPDVILKENEYFILMCSGDTNLTNTEYYHANIKISDNDSIFLSKDNKIIDCIHIGNVPLDYSYGRGNDGRLYYMEPSPLQKNSEGKISVSSEPIIQLPAGIYNNVDTLKVSITCFNDVYYTLNGNEPTIYDKKYEDEIILDSTCVLKAKSFSDGEISSNSATATYIINEPHDIPIVSLSLNENDFRNINAHYSMHDYYFKGYVEYFDGEKGFNSNCGIGIYGDESRQYRKKNYVMKFDKEFGANDLAYKVFDDRDTASYDTLCLRAGGQDWDEGIIRDSFLTSLIDDYTSVAAYTCKNVVVYINGEYWGLYVIKEKKSHGYFEENYNINPESINLVKGYLEAEWGSMDGYEEIRQYCLNNDVTTKQAYDYLSSKLDMENWADFWIGHLYCANIDYNNLRFFQSDEYNDGKWMCIFYDLDFAMTIGYTHNTYRNSLTRSDGFWCFWIDQYGVGHNRVDNTIIKSLLKNPYFQELWLERLKYNLDTTWNAQRMLEYLDTYEKELSGEIVRDRAIWGQSLQVYNDEIEKIRDFINHRQSYLMTYTKDFFNLSDEKMKELFGDLYE